jgi:hypothetical protein
MSEGKAPAKTPIRSHRDLIVWQKAIDLVVNVYRDTEAFPKTETYGLTSQIRRAVTSIPANIAEGQGRRLPGEYLYFRKRERLIIRVGHPSGSGLTNSISQHRAPSSVTGSTAGGRKSS